MGQGGKRYASPILLFGAMSQCWGMLRLVVEKDDLSASVPNQEDGMWGSLGGRDLEAV